MRWRLAALRDRLTKGQHTMTSTQPEAEAAAAAVIPRGLDYAWPPHPPVLAMKAAGISFVVRYLSLDPKKNLTAAERDTLLAAGIRIALVWETTARRMLGGRAAGKADALTADSQAIGLKMTGIPLYFACDFDAAHGDQTLINAYLDGVADSIGRARTGIYGGYWPLSRALDAKKATWAWQTTAWSGGKWDARAQLRQTGSISVAGIKVDLDEAHAADYGQWPRPAPPGPFRHVVPAGNTQTWPQLIKSRNADEDKLAAVTRAKLSAVNLAVFDTFLAHDLACKAAGLARPAMTPGMVYYTSNK